MKLRTAVVSDIDSLQHLLEALFTIEQDFTPDQEKQRRGLERLLEAPNAHVAVTEEVGEVFSVADATGVISTAEGDSA